MPEIYTELTSPTAVTHSLTLPFTSLTAENLILAKTTILQIFITTSVPTELAAPAPLTPEGGVDRRLSDGADEEQGAFAGELTLQRSKVEDVAKLRLIAEFMLAGEISGVVRITPADRYRGRIGGCAGGKGRVGGGDFLLVSFRDAKMSLLAWNVERHTIETISLHYYERDEFWSPVVSEGLPSLLVVDPGMRAVVLKFAGDMLAVLPVRQEGEEEEILDAVEDVDMPDAVGGEDDDWDPNVPEKAILEQKLPKINGEGIKANKDSKKPDSPFHPSFVVSAAQLDDAISHVLSLAFLHEYREPTLGILYSPRWTWTGWLEERRDTLCYIVITLDLEQKASTPIISVQGLPYDLFKVVPLTPPIGGSLLLGANEIIHVDQAGTSTGVAVNSFAKKTTKFPGLADQSSLGFALEGSTVVELEGEGGDILLLMKDGRVAIVGFRMDGRNVSGVKVTNIANHCGPLLGGRATTAVSLGSRRLFVGCDEGDARVLKWRRKGEKKKQILEGALEDQDVEDIYNMLEDIDDDLYGSSSADLSTARKDIVFTDAKIGDSTIQGEYLFQTHDRVINLGPFRNFTMGRPAFPADTMEKQKGVVPELEIIATTGPTSTEEDAGLSLIRRSIVPTIVGRFEFPACKALWTVRANRIKQSSSVETAQATGQQEEQSVDEEYDKYLFVSKDGDSQVFRVRDAFEEVRGTDFDSDGDSLEVGTVGEGARVVQVVSEQVRVYDCDMQLTQIVPMFNEETGEDGPSIIKASICDPYVVLLRVDGSVVIYKLDKSMELAEEDKDGIKGIKYKCGSLYKARPGEVVLAEKETKNYILCLLTVNEVLQIFKLPDLQTPIFKTDQFGTVPPVLGTMSPQYINTAATTAATSSAAAATDDITEILLADLGDYVVKEPYLIVRNSLDDLVIYKLILQPSSSILSFIKIPNPIIAAPRPGLTGKPKFHSMIAMDNVGGYACIFFPGSDPGFILKTAKSIPRLHPLAGTAVRSLSPFHTVGAERGFIYVDTAGVIRVSLFPGAEWNFDNSWGARKIYFNEPLRAVTWYDPMSVCIATTTKKNPFSIDEEDGKPIEADTSGQLPPTIDSSSLVIVSPHTWSIVDRYLFAYNEAALVVTTVSLEISEHTKERRQLVAVGTGIFRGEDQPARGGIYVFEVIEVVPEPGKPETNRKLKLVTREEVKGTVSAVTGVNGYLLAAQGQKIMVRGLKEDQSLLPVAFMDMNCYVTVAKSFSAGPLVLFGDFMKSVWFAGFGEEPYKMTLFGKDVQNMEVISAEFLPDADGRGLCFVVADANGDLHVLQYDPEHPKSLGGQRLIRKASFHTANEIQSLKLLPSSSSSEPDSESFLVLAATRSGSLAAISTLSETSYRRLNIVQNAISMSEEHSAGLNPKAFRHVAVNDCMGEILRGVLDGNVVERWTALSVGRRWEVAVRAGPGGDRATDRVRGDLAAVRGGLRYL